MSDIGWIKLHRQFLNWEWFEDANMVKFFIYCLMRANHKPSKWRGIVVNSGEFITSISSLSAELKLSAQSVRTIINRLKSTNELTSRSTSKYTIISVTYWEKYQDANKQLTNEQQTTNKQLTTDKNDNNDKKKTRGFIKPSIEEIKAYFEEKKYNLDADEFFHHYEANGWMRGKTKIVSWKSCAQTWLKNQKSNNNKPAVVIPMPKEFTGWENEH